MQNWQKISLVLCCVGLLVSEQAEAESWNYQSYHDGVRYNPGYVTLEVEGGASIVRIVAPGLEKCLQTDLNASVERTDQTIVITAKSKLIGCEEIRFVIKADGSGGYRQVKKGEKWVSDKKDRLLTIRK